MEDFITGLTLIILGIAFAIQLIRWIWTAPGEFVRLLQQGPSPKLTFVFIGMGLAILCLLVFQSTEVSFEAQPGVYLIGLAASAAIAGILYHIYLSTKYQTVGYFFLIVFKILLVVVPTIIISIVAKNLVWGFAYFFVMLLITYYSVYRIKTNSSNGKGTMTGNQTLSISASKVIKYLLSSVFQAVLGYFISSILSNIFS